MYPALYKYLPAGGAVAVALVLEIRHALHHPVVDLRESEALLGRALDSLGDQVSVRHVAPGVAPCRAALPLRRRRSRCRRGGK